ncbi:MAG: DUF2889 domain-containing protein [Austwickia sp.]|nr:DUF2889 domain-containing protein [Austwickia sp.]
MSRETLEHNGLPGPTLAPPPRRPGSVRRTSNFDLFRPDGPYGRLEILGRARDLHTEPGGTTQVRATGMVSGTVIDQVVTRLVTHPAAPGTPGLVGRKASVGWRTGVWRGLREHYDAGTPLHLILDELPVGLIIAGYTYRRSKTDNEPHKGRQPGVCAGWAADSRAMNIFSATGTPPPAVIPPNIPLADPADPIGWHTMPELPVWGISRRRRMDVWRADGGIQFDAMFRDVFRDDADAHGVLHEYGVHGLIGPDGRVRHLQAVPRVLPHKECPISAASVTALVGVPAASLRERVSMELFGPSTCTHLNDLLRFLADAPAVASTLPH